MFVCARAQGCAGRGAPCAARPCVSELTAVLGVFRGVEVAVPLGGGSGAGAVGVLGLPGSGAVRGGEGLRVRRGEGAAVCVRAGKGGGLRESGVCPLCRSVRALRLGNCSWCARSRVCRVRRALEFALGGMRAPCCGWVVPSRVLDPLQ